MAYNFIAEHGVQVKKIIKSKIKMIKKLTGVKLSINQLERMKEEQSDEVFIPVTTVKYILGVMGHQIFIVEVMDGDTVYYRNDEWDIVISPSAHQSKLIGIITRITGPNCKIVNFTKMAYLEKIKQESKSPDSWEKWFEEKAKTAAFRQTVRNSEYGILMKSIIKISKSDNKITSNTEFLSLIEELEAGISNNKSTVKEKEQNIETVPFVTPFDQTHTVTDEPISPSSENNKQSIEKPPIDGIPTVTVEPISPSNEETQLTESIQTINIEPIIEHKSSEDTISVRAWMVEFGQLEKRRKVEGGSKELFDEAIKLRNKRPTELKEGMLTLDKYKG
jgi:hypothetical protein